MENCTLAFDRVTLSLEVGTDLQRVVLRHLYRDLRGSIEPFKFAVHH